MNRPLDDEQVQALRTSVNRGRPHGDADWTRQAAARLDLEHIMSNAGRPRKKDNQ